MSDRRPRGPLRGDLTARLPDVRPPRLVPGSASRRPPIRSGPARTRPAIGSSCSPRWAGTSTSSDRGSPRCSSRSPTWPRRSSAPSRKGGRSDAGPDRLQSEGGRRQELDLLPFGRALAALGEGVLLIDCDPQASLTQGFFGSAAAGVMRPKATVAGVFAGGSASAEDLALPTGSPGIEIIPGHAALGRYNLADPEATDEATQEVLADFLMPFTVTREGWTIIDTPPNLHLCTWAALAASDAFIIPLQPEDYSVAGGRPGPRLRRAGPRGAQPEAAGDRPAADQGRRPDGIPPDVRGPAPRELRQAGAGVDRCRCGSSSPSRSMPACRSPAIRPGAGAPARWTPWSSRSRSRYDLFTRTGVCFE